MDLTVFQLDRHLQRGVYRQNTPDIQKEWEGMNDWIKSIGLSRTGICDF